MTPEQKDLIHKLLLPDEYGKRNTLQQVSDMFGVSRERIRQINGNVGHRDCVKKLRRKKVYWAKRLYAKQDITIEELCAMFGISKQVVISVVGSRLDYERATGKRKCKDCGKVKKFPDDFYKNGAMAYTRFCNKCNTKRVKKWMDDNREHVNEYAREYRKTDKAKAYYQKYWREHK